MELRVDRERCIGAGMCALTAPTAFDQDDADGRVLLLDTAADPEGIREAARLCPSGALTIVN
ncbi:ferredoxin [Nocardia sp. NEAU-G5]|jgi:ferredoxin|uniref:Ferredoxin n=1 Tax=Nocardia albiluteola TaxID=2842303 RepID=A0ABS6ATW3_9NOCA|nr:ferredoxin [Nocardia albiluteola]MBU3060976.1 ferredoxin [Nocardia albiluteola]